MDANAIPGYIIKKKIGMGAMAAVYLARDEKLDRDVALKIMSEKLLNDPSFAERFVREAKIVASISHQNIVTVFDVGTHEGRHYMAMEYLPGGDLSSKLRKGLPLVEAIKHVKEIAEGLHYAASKNFIHRDIKPDNIMFAEDGRAVITDFGIARNTDSETNMTIAGSIIGTPQYMSPEQASAEKLDHRTDLYSLGIILYEILTGKPPFKGDSAISTGVMHITQPVPMLPYEFEEFQEFIDIALAKNPDNRFQSGRQFIKELNLIDLDEFQNTEAATVFISQEDVADALGNSGIDSGLMSNVNSNPLSSVLSSDAGAFRVIDPNKRSGLVTMLIMMLVICIGGMLWHVYYVNVLGKQVNVVPAAKSLISFSNTVGIRLDLKQPVIWIHRKSKQFGEFTDDVIGDWLPKAKK